VEQGIAWFDLVPGTKNPADLCTKNLAIIGEFPEKNGIIFGSKPLLYESKGARAILAGGHTPILKSKKKTEKQQNKEIHRNHDCISTSQNQLMTIQTQGLLHSVVRMMFRPRKFWHSEALSTPPYHRRTAIDGERDHTRLRF